MFPGEQFRAGNASYVGAVLVDEPTLPLPLLPSGYTDSLSEFAEAPHLLSPHEIISGMTANTRTPVANGYTLVPDFRPAGFEDDFIPEETYTWYYMNGAIPFAGVGENRGHDRRHALSYYRLFQSPSLANCVQNAATDSYWQGRSFYFTRAMDSLGDRHILLTSPGDLTDIARDFGDIVSAQLQLQRLVRLSFGEDISVDHPLTGNQLKVFSCIWHETDFAELQAKNHAALTLLSDDEKAAIFYKYAPDPEEQPNR